MDSMLLWCETCVMKIDLKPGKYIVAVSGGVDSMVLLYLLSQLRDVEIVVVHINENLRPDSPLDQKLVKETAKKYGLEFYTTDVKLDNSSEALGRKVRYEYLNKIKNETGAKAIITAHHQDDMLETAIINLLRGTGRRGLTSLSSRDNLVRPLLKYSKKEIYAFAQSCGLKWHEDYMNKDIKFLRNHIRHVILPKLGLEKRNQLLLNIQNLSRLNQAIDEALKVLLKQELDKRFFLSLPHDVALEAMAAWLRQNNVAFDKKKLNKLTLAIKTLSAGKRVEISKRSGIYIEKERVTLYNR